MFWGDIEGAGKAQTTTTPTQTTSRSPPPLGSIAPMDTKSLNPF